MQKLKTIPFLIPQHVKEAAFCWQMVNYSRLSPLANLEKIKSYQRLLNAHLDALVLSQDSGFDIAFKNFEKFKTQGESYVAWYLALALNKDNDTFKKLWNLTKRHRETTWQGTVSALAYLSPDNLKKRIDMLLSDCTSADQKALGLSLAAVRRAPITAEVLQKLLQHQDPFLRSKVYHWFGRCGEQDNLPTVKLFEMGSADQNFQVYEANAIANILMQPRMVTNPQTLLKVLQHRISLAKTEKGLAKLISQRRCDLLAAYLGHTVKVGHQNFYLWIKELPARLALIALAHHGDSGCLPEIIAAMEDKDTAAIAFWAFCFISGLNQDNAEMLLFIDEPQDEPVQNMHPSDVGLGIPNIAAIKKWYRSNSDKLPKNTAILHGKIASADYAETLFNSSSSTQATRFAAALHAKFFNPKSLWQDNRKSPFAIEYIV